MLCVQVCGGDAVKEQDEGVLGPPRLCCREGRPTAPGLRISARHHGPHDGQA